MTNHFILNPVSGKKKPDNSILREIRDVSGELGEESLVYFTKSKGDGERHIREICSEAEKNGETLRIFGIGGDGTVNEVVNGVAGFENVEIGIIPAGTGNDYVRNYGEPSEFTDVRRQLLGTSVYSDLIRYTGEYMGETTERYCANMVNIGFDCNVVRNADRLREKTPLSGSFAYLTSVFITLGRKEETDMTIRYEDGRVRDGKVLLCSIANGCYCGGGIKGVPRCVLDDGLMDVSVVRAGVSRLRFVSKFPKYSRGVHLEDEKSKELELFDYRQEKELSVSSKTPLGMFFCVDGETVSYERVRFTVAEKAVRFIVPEGI